MLKISKKKAFTKEKFGKKTKRSFNILKYSNVQREIF